MKLWVDTRPASSQAISTVVNQGHHGGCQLGPLGDAISNAGCGAPSFVEPKSQHQ